MSWRNAKIGEICDLMTGGTPSTKVPEYYQDGDVPWVASGDIHRINIKDTDKKITKLGVENSPAKYLPRDSVLIALNGQGKTRGTVGMLRIANATCNQSVVSINPISTDILDSFYLFQVLRSMYKAIRNITGDKDRTGLNMRLISEIEIPLPPLGEQKRIAAILDQADELRRKRQRAIDHLNQLGQAIFHEMFGDPKSNPRGLRRVALGEMADFYSGNSLPGGEPYEGQADGHLLLKVSDLNHELNQQDIVCAAAWSPVPGSRAGTCPPNALIFPKRGGAIGTNKKRWLRRSAILDPNLMGVHPKEEELTMHFLNGWFQTFNLSDIASGSSVPQLNKQDLAPLEIPLPSIDQQMEYAERMDALSATRRSAAVALDYDSQLFTSLQHRAFRGEL